MSEKTTTEQYEGLGERKLSPKQEVQSETLYEITKHLDDIELDPKDEAIVEEYASKAAEFAGEEFERLQKESPINLLISVVNEVISGTEDRDVKAYLDERIKSLSEKAEGWRKLIEAEESYNLFTHQSRSRLEVIKDLIQKGEIDSFFSFDFDIFHTNEKTGLNNLLEKLDVLPKGFDVETAFSKFPKARYSFRNEEEVRKIREEKRPTLIKGAKALIGIGSEILPGVEFTIQGEFINRRVLCLDFKPEAVVRSVP